MRSRFFKEDAAGSSPAADRKLKQLCREVYRVLVQELPGESRDPILESVSVLDVRPAPDGSRLAVQVSVAPGVDPAGVLAGLQRRKGYLRAEIASAIQRKRTPELAFEVLP
jgi:ribosome-binding factor A